MLNTKATKSGNTMNMTKSSMQQICWCTLTLTSRTSSSSALSCSICASVSARLALVSLITFASSPRKHASCSDSVTAIDDAWPESACAPVSSCSTLEWSAFSAQIELNWDASSDVWWNNQSSTAKNQPKNVFYRLVLKQKLFFVWSKHQLCCKLSQKMGNRVKKTEFFG